MSLPPEACAELTDRLVASAAETLASELERAHLEEIGRRIVRVEAGEIQPVPSGRVFAVGCALLASLSKARQNLERAAERFMPSTAHRFEPDAQAEHNQAIRHCVTEAGEAVAASFVAQVKSGVATICTAPRMWRIDKSPTSAAV